MFKTSLTILATGTVTVAAGFCAYLLYKSTQKKRKYQSEVIIFPDRRLDVDESRAEKVIKSIELYRVYRGMEDETPCSTKNSVEIQLN